MHTPWGGEVMTPFLRGTVEAIVEAFDLPGPVLEVGSLQVGGSEPIDLRRLLAGKPYAGVDIRPGPGVDCVADAEALPQATASIGTVLALSTFEHVRRFWVAFDEVYRVLRPDGVFVCAVPFYFRVHAHPSDYWRFTPDAVDFLLERYPTRLVGWHGPDRRVTCVWAVAFREQARGPTPEQMDRYRRLMAAYAKEPLPWGKRVRHRVGAALFGRRPFAPFLDREKWAVELRHTPAPVAAGPPAGRRAGLSPPDAAGRRRAPSHN